ncbi:MAG: OmpA family protein [Bacteriovoracaceae bacterium]|nr:OmpA family protein [Bacteroidota bacterium]
MKTLRYSILLILPLFIPACVSIGTFDEMQAHRDALQITVDSLKTATAGLQSRVDELTKENTALKDQQTIDHTLIAELQAMTDTLKDRVRTLENDLTISQQNYEQSKAKNSAEIKKLLTNLEGLQKDLATREQKLRDYEEALALRDSSLAAIQRDLIGREQRVGDLERRLAARDSSLHALKARLNDALLGFTNSGLSINIVNGRVYVSLSNQLLFTTGKADIDKRGKEALLELAHVLNTQEDLTILVEGHTDDQAVKNLGAIKDNWDLSVVRATEVIRYLADEGKVDPKRITASGRSEYFPIDPANTSEARAKNRRTEIILIPKLSELFEILEQ